MISLIAHLCGCLTLHVCTFWELIFVFFVDWLQPKLALQMKADLDNVADILPNGDDFRWHLKVTLCYCFAYISIFIVCRRVCCSVMSLYLDCIFCPAFDMTDCFYFLFIYCCEDPIVV